MNLVNIFDIEIRLNPKCNTNICNEELIAELKQNAPEFVVNFQAFLPENEKLREKVDRVVIGCASQANGARLQCTKEQLESANFYVYTVKNFGAMAEGVGNEEEETTGESSAIGSYHWELPAIEFEGLWESLIYSFRDCPKQEVLSFIKVSMEFANHCVDPTIIPQNRLILLNGPPGTGKTTLCKALAQKMAIRMENQYKRTLLVEVNSHSLFSKWFSESGKLIQKLFTRIEELAEHTDWLVFVLIDEVESLTMGREAAFSGNDPTDSVRAVNAVLTQLDRMRRHKNVYMLCTSNIEKALDLAFLDRVGLVRYIAHPEEHAIAEILRNCTAELNRAGLLANPSDWTDELEQEKCTQISRHSARAQLSGRALRRLPTVAYSLALHSAGGIKPVNVDIYLNCMQQEAEKLEAKKKPKKSPAKEPLNDMTNLLNSMPSLY